MDVRVAGALPASSVLVRFLPGMCVLGTPSRTMRMEADG